MVGTTILCCVKFQESAGLIYITAEAWNYIFFIKWFGTMCVLACVYGAMWGFEDMKEYWVSVGDTGCQVVHHFWDQDQWGVCYPVVLSPIPWKGRRGNWSCSVTFIRYKALLTFREKVMIMNCSSKLSDWSLDFNYFMVGVNCNQLNVIN
jgi:hypothetical protein